MARRHRSGPRRKETHRRRPGPKDAASAPGWRSASLGAAALIAVAALTWSTSFGGVFVYDDIPAIVRNETIRSVPASLVPPPGITLSGRPIANLSFALNYAFTSGGAGDAPSSDQAGYSATAFQRNVWSYHAVNLAVHLLASLMLFGVMRRTLDTERLKPYAGDAVPVLAFTVALIWLVHPVQTQAVTYVVQRAESLMGLFYLTTLYCAIRATDVTTDRWRWWIAAAVASCALGMGTKEVMITAPVIVWLWSWVFAPSTADDAVVVRARRILHSGLAATWVLLAGLLTFESQGRLVLSRGLSPAGLEGWTWWSYLLTQTGVITHYLGLVFWPSPLVFDYYDWPQAQSLTEAAPRVVFMAAMTGLTAVALLRRNALGFAGAWFLLILVPTSSVFPISTEIAAEHRLYLPIAAPIAVTVVGVFAAARRFAGRPGMPAGPVSRRILTVTATAALVIVVAGLAAATRERNRDYWTDEGLWQDTVSKRPGNARARINYGIDLMSSRRYTEAEQQMRAAIELPADLKTRAQAHLQLGSALSAQGRVDEGVAHLEHALRLDPAIREADAILGQAYSERGDLSLALKHLRRAVDRVPDNPWLLHRTSWLLATAPDEELRDGELAVRLAERAERLTAGQEPAVLESLAAAYAEVGRFEDAGVAARRALALVRAAGQLDSAATLMQHLTLYERRVKLRVHPASPLDGPAPRQK
ncbi:MAG TPA: tetratricopeptide repeat protein [Vicinamibacterales bacterium]|nr:tetratricopeptide repeat protein [Vicinamibacterales bacterium]